MEISKNIFNLVNIKILYFIHNLNIISDLKIFGLDLEDLK